VAEVSSAGLAATAIVCAFKHYPFPEDCSSFEHRYAASLRVLAEHVAPVSTNRRQTKIRSAILAIASRLEVRRG
jgi:hypothetical protein